MLRSFSKLSFSSPFTGCNTTIKKEKCCSLTVVKAHVKVSVICQYVVILRFLHMLKPSPFPHNQVNFECLDQQSERLSITEAAMGLYISRKCFWSFFYIEFHRNMVASNMHFEYQMLTDLF